MILTFIVRISYWLYFFKRFPAQDETKISGINKGVSVLICVKNGVEYLVQNLPSILKQQYPLFEIVIVDDYSEDDLKSYVESLDDPKVKYILSKENILGKKKAIETGVDYAQFDLILATDVDCIPRSRIWIKTMVDALDEDGEVVLGFGQLKGKNGVLAKFVQYETIQVAMQYFSYSAKKLAYMGVGRNLLFIKSVFVDVNPYRDNYHTPGGDDDVFVSRAASSGKVIKTCINKLAWTVSGTKDDWISFINQKTRHVSSSIHYNSKIKILLGAFAMSNIAFYVFAFWNIAMGSLGITIIVMLCFYLLASLIQRRIFRALGGEKLFRFWPLFDLTFAAYLIVLGVLSLFYTKKW